MNWKLKFLLLYLLVGSAGVLFIEFQNLVILNLPFEEVIKYNLPFVILQNFIFVVVYYIYTIRKLGDLFQANEEDIVYLPYNERKRWFEKLIKFPTNLFRFSIFFMFGLALAFHLYSFLINDQQLTKDFLVSVLFSLLIEMSLAMLIILMVLGAVTKALRPYILKLRIASIEEITFPLSKKIYLLFFSILFIFLVDSIRIVNIEGSIQSQLIKGTATLCLLSILAVVVIKFSLLDSISSIRAIAQNISDKSQKDRASLHSIIPITSNDEIGYLIGSFNKLQVEIQRLYTELEDELQLALTVQQNLLPKKSQKIGNYVVEGLTIPVKEVGGDFFDIMKLNDRKMAVLVGDVSGKGIPAALLMSVVLGVIRGKIQTDILTPVQLLESINKVLIPMLSDGMFVTAGIGIIDYDLNLFTYASAGHVPPLVKRGSDLEFIELSSLPLGIDLTESYEEIVIPLTDIEGVVLYSDGMIEQVNEYEEMFSFERLKQLFLREWDKETQAIMSDLKDFYRNSKQTDDMTIVRFKKM